MEDVAAGHAERLLQVEGGLRLDARVAVRVGKQERFDRFAEHAVEGREHGVAEPAAHRRVVLFVNKSVGNVQSEDGEGLRTSLLKLRRQDARVAERVAVDLRGQRARHLAAGGGPVGPLQLVVALVDVEGAAERGARV